MPRVPVLDTQVRATPTQVAQQSTNAPVEAFGGNSNYQNQTYALNRIQDTISGIAAEQKQRADDAFGKDIYSQVARKKNEIVYGKNDENGNVVTPGLINKKGKEAFNAPDDGISEFEKYKGEIIGQASNETQRQFISNLFLKEGDELHGTLSRHSNTEMDNYRKGATVAAVDAATNDAVLNYVMPGKVQDSLNTQAGAIREYMHGSSEPEIQSAIGKAASKTHGAVIDRMVELGEDQKAEEYLNQVKPQISDASILVAAEKRVESGSRLGQSRRISDDILANAKDETQALQMLKDKNIADTKLFDATTDRIRNQYTINRTANQQATEQTTNDFYNQIEGNPSSFAQIQAGKEWDALEPRQKDSLIAKHKRMLEGLDVATDPRAMNDLLQLASNPTTRDAFMKTDLVSSYADKLNRTDLTSMQKLQYGVRKQDADAIAKLDGIMTDDQIVKNTMLNVLKVNPAHKGNADQVAEFRDAVSRRFAEEAKAQGKPLKDDQKADIANSMGVRAVTEKGIFWDTKVPTYKLAPGQAFEIPVENIPAPETLKIQQALRSRGQPVTKENIIKLYQMKYLPNQAGVR